MLLTQSCDSKSDLKKTNCTYFLGLHDDARLIMETKSSFISQSVCSLCSNSKLCCTYSHRRPAELQVSGQLLHAKEVQLWFASLSADRVDVQRLFTLLDRREQHRAQRLQSTSDRSLFTVAHAFLRQVLGAQLGILPEHIRFRYELHGKPALAHATQLHFNLSHSGDVAVAAVARGRQVGVDVEVMREVPDLSDICGRYFTSAETRRVLGSTGVGRLRSFYVHWTGKEAYLKAQGTGLFAPLNSFEVIPHSTDLGPHLRLDDLRERGRWSLRCCQLREDIMCSVVAEGHDWRLRAAEWLPVEGRGGPVFACNYDLHSHLPENTFPE
jgi:4'-phosphopantetheinyl transferase